MPNYDKDRQIELYKQWQEEDDDQALGELMDELDPIVESKAQDITPPDLEKETVKSHIRNQIAKDLPEYDPEETAMSTYLYNFSLPKTNRYVNTYQNTARIPEARTQKISTFNEAKQQLKDDFNREPSDQELSDELGWSIKEVRRMQKSQRQEIPESSFDMIGNFEAESHSELDDVYHYMIYELDPEEQIVFKHLTGFDNTEKLSGKEIAQKMDVSPAKVSKIKKKINNKMQQYV